MEIGRDYLRSLPTEVFLSACRGDEVGNGKVATVTSIILRVIDLYEFLEENLNLIIFFTSIS